MTQRATTNPRRDRAITERVARWFRANARLLPWRAVGADGRRDPYRALVSELMLQQTQVSRVLEKYALFVERFPTVGALARAADEDVLAAWSGLGYYRRARLLHAAAREIVERHNGSTPSDPSMLRSLPGVGRYTAGAVASIVFDRPEPIVDGNVARVLLRVDGRELNPAESATQRFLWSRADALVNRAASQIGVGAGTFNEGLMELGAVVCTPSAPRCPACPLATLCRARRLNTIASIPAPKRRPASRTIHHDALLVIDARGRRLVERRAEVGAGGLWAGLWQPPTLESRSRPPTVRRVRAWAGGPIERVGSFDHRLSHRLVRFRVWRWVGVGTPLVAGGRWRSPASIARVAVSNPHRRILTEY